MESERLLLRKWELEDAPTLAKKLNVKEIAYNLGTKYPYSEEDARSYIVDAIKHNKEKYAIILKETREIIGGCGLHLQNEKTSASGNMWITKDKQGRGFGTEAFKLLVAHCFSTQGVEKMDNVFFCRNIASQKMQEKIGSVVVEGEKLIIVGDEVRVKKTAVLTKENFERMLSRGTDGDAP